jgi:hypothetical protein
MFFCIREILQSNVVAIVLSWTGTQFRYCCYCSSVLERWYSTLLFLFFFFCIRQMLISSVFATVILCSRDISIRKLLILLFCIGDVLCTNIVAIVPMYLRECILYECVVIVVCLHLRGDTRYGCCCCSSVFEIYLFWMLQFVFDICRIRMSLQYFCIRHISD